MSLDLAALLFPPNPLLRQRRPVEPQEPSRPIDRGLDTETLLKEVLEHFQESSTYMMALWPRWLRYYQFFRGYNPAKRPWRARIFVPIPFANTMHGLAMLMEAWYVAGRPQTRVFPVEGGDLEGAQIVEDYLDWEDEKMVAFLPIYDSNQDMLLYGTGWTKTYWDWANKRNQTESVSPWAVFIDPSATDVDDADYLQHRVLRSPAYIKELIRQGVYEMDEDEVDRLAAAGLEHRLQSDDLLANVGLGVKLHRNRLELIEEWRNPGREAGVITVINRRFVVRAKKRIPLPHGQIPFARWVDHAVAHEALGIGELEVIEKLVEEKSDIRNQRLDAVALSLNPMLIASMLAGVDPETLVWEPGGIVWANDTNAIKPFFFQSQPFLSVQEEQIADFDIQQATGNWGYNQGQQPLRRETATTVLALQRAAGRRFTMKVAYNERSAMQRVARQRIANAQAFMPPERWIRVTGQPLPQMINRESIQGDWDYIPAASSAEPKEVKRQQIAQILPLLLNHPRLDDEEFLPMILDIYGLRKERSRILLSNEEMMAKMAQMAQVQAMARARGNGGPGGAASPDLNSPGAERLPALEGIAGAEGDGFGL